MFLVQCLLIFCSLVVCCFRLEKTSFLKNIAETVPKLLLFQFELDLQASKCLQSLLYVRFCRNYILGKKKSFAALERLKTSFSVRFLQPFIENFNFIKVSLSSFLPANSSLFSTFPTTFLSSVTMNLIFPLIPNESKNKSLLFGEMFKILH